MFLKNQWYVAALPEELGIAPIARTLCGEPVALYRTASGRAVALEDRCPHRFAPLSIGKCAGETLTCAYHGIVFGADGACVSIPQQATIPPRMRVRSYPLAERWGLVWIWMGDAADANPENIPEYSWLTAPGWHHIFRRYPVKAGYEICADNILDLSHTPFIHTGSIGTPEMATIPVATEVVGRKVISRRIMHQVTPGPFVYAWGNFGEKIDRVTTTEWLPAGNTSVELCYQDANNKITLRLTNANTPETERSTHLYFIWSRDFGSDADDDFARRFKKESFQVMDEDIAIIERQQAVIDRGLPVPTVGITADATLIQARRMVQSLLEEERTRGERKSA
jgi:vanillate O-demethylase monooxygenase subunit